MIKLKFFLFFSKLSNILLKYNFPIVTEINMMILRKQQKLFTILNAVTYLLQK